MWQGVASGRILLCQHVSVVQAAMKAIAGHVMYYSYIYTVLIIPGCVASDRNLLQLA